MTQKEFEELKIGDRVDIETDHDGRVVANVFGFNKDRSSIMAEAVFCDHYEFYDRVDMKNITRKKAGK